ncbi:hypothetical protein [Methyloceanibacter stevinii]|uniref:hypothetical protein n=1 Tax=Methyloceanibacter stevinii TaxID=1774970 RepID=UPI00130195CE|nr:hypothetical protein [Methyloceanibacter stevinii]
MRERLDVCVLGLEGLAGRVLLRAGLGALEAPEAPLEAFFGFSTGLAVVISIAGSS